MTKNDALNITIPELLSPAGSEKAVRAAVNAGADAVYFGGKAGNARVGAENIGDDRLEAVVDYCHVRGVKAYITVNSVYTDEELADALKFAEKAYACGADALIIADIGFAYAVKERFPGIPLHASTQMTAHSLNDVLFLERAGFDSVTLARELSLAEIKRITERVKIKTEVFAHGALCVCYSGRCYMSAFIDAKGGRSGNKGSCAQPCRKFYTLTRGAAPVKTGHLLSPRDLSAFGILEDITGAGVYALKIEGRMKSPEYVYAVTLAYREKLDAIRSGAKYEPGETFERVEKIFNRGGFTDGYFNSHSSFSMMSVKKPGNAGTRVGTVESYDYVSGKCRIKTEAALVPGDGLEIWTKTPPHAGGAVNRAANTGETAIINVKGEYNIQNGDAVYRVTDKKLNDELAKLAASETRKTAVTGYFKALTGEKFYIKLICDGVRAESYGEIVNEAANRPVSAGMIIEHASKTGPSPFVIEYNNYDAGDNIYIGIKNINQTRRAALSTLEQNIAGKYKRVYAPAGDQTPVENKTKHAREKVLTALVSDAAQLDAVINAGGTVSVVYAEINCFELLEADYINAICEKCAENGIELFAALPRIQHTEAESHIAAFEKTKISGYLARTYGQIYELSNTEPVGANFVRPHSLTNKKIAADYVFNVSNGRALEFFENAGAVWTALSVELSLNDIKNFAGERSEIIIYGRQELMMTRQCPAGIYDANKSSGKFCALKDKTLNNKYKNSGFIYGLKDQTGVSFPVMPDCAICAARIYNDRPTYMIDKARDLKNAGARYLRLVFTDETAERVSEVINAAGNALKGAAVTEDGRFLISGKFTRGHYYNDKD